MAGSPRRVVAARGTSAGSSSVKFGLYDIEDLDNLRLVARGTLGEGNAPRLVANAPDGETLCDVPVTGGDTAEPVRMLVRWIEEIPFFETKKRTIETYYNTSTEHSSSTANELLQGVNPLAGIVHGRSILAETVQKVVIENMKAADAAKWGHAQLEQVRKEHIHLVL